MSATAGFLLGSIVTVGLHYLWVTYIRRKITNDPLSKGLLNNGNDHNQGYGSTTSDNKKRSAYDVISGVSQSGFLTEIVGQLWPYINIMGCQIIKETVEPTFATDLPSPLSTLHFSKLDLGTIPIRLDNIVVHEVDLKNNQLQLELDVIWDGQCDIELKADYIGRLGVKHVKLSGRMSIMLKPLIGSGSIIQAVQFGFVNPPMIDIDFTGLAQIADLSIIDKGVRNCIQSVLKTILVLPNRMTTRLDNTPKFYNIYQPPLGIVRITILRGTGFQIQKNTLSKDDIPDVYCTMTIGNITWQTSIIKDCTTPIWNETYDVILYNYDQILFLDVHDRDSGTLVNSDDLLGQCQITIGEILLSTNRIREVELIDNNHKGTNSYIRICADLCSFTTDNIESLNDQKKILKTKNGEIPKDRFVYAVLTIVISSVSSIPITNEKESNCYMKIQYGDAGTKNENCTFQTEPIVGSVNPIYDVAYTVLITQDIKPSDITFSLYNDYKKPLSKDKKKQEKTEPILLGTNIVYHQHILDAPNHTMTENRAIGTQGATLEYQVKLYGLQIPKESSKVKALNITDDELFLQSSTATAGGTRADINSGENISVTLSIKSGRGFMQQRRRLSHKIFHGDIPDCYIKTRVGPIPHIWRTKTIKDHEAPIWNEQKDYTNIHYGMIVTFDVYDEDTGKLDKDDYVGTSRASIGKLVLAGGPVEIELQDKNGYSTGAYITVECNKIQGTTTTSTDNIENKAGDVIDGSRKIAKPVPLNPPYQVLSRTANQLEEELVSVRIIVADGHGFQIEKKKKILKKDDIPDCYCLINVKEDPCYTNQVWKTTVITNNIQPIWNESQDFYFVRHSMTLNIDVWDSDSGNDDDDDDYLGNAQIVISQLLATPNERIEVLLNLHGDPTGSFITLIGEEITPPELKTTSADLPVVVITSKNVYNEPPLDVLTPGTISNMVTKDLLAVQIKIVSGRGFQIEKRKLKRDDIPDCYCNVKVGPNDYVWRTSTIKDILTPIWNESKMYHFVQYGMMIHIEVYDEDTGIHDPDDFLGSAKISVSSLVDKLGAAVEIPLYGSNGSLNSCYITLIAEHVASMTDSSTAPIATEADKSQVTATTTTTSPAVIVETKSNVNPITSPPTETVDDTKKTLKPQYDSDIVSIRCNVISGRKFPIEKRKLRKDDIPDCYCKINLRSNKTDIWKTTTIKDNCDPKWSNENKIYHNIKLDDTFHIEVWDEDSGIRDPDDFLGENNITVRNILELNGTVTELTLCTDGKPNGSYISLQFELISE